MRANNPLRSGILIILFICLCVVSLCFFAEDKNTIPASNAKQETPQAYSSRMVKSNISSRNPVMPFANAPIELSGYRAELKKPPLIFQPLVFQIDAVNAEEFSTEEEAIIHEVQEYFAAEMAAYSNQDSTSPEYRKHWSTMQRKADSLLLLRLGAEGFNRFNTLAMQQAEQE
jgi:hypothetical protein